MRVRRLLALAIAMGAVGLGAAFAGCTDLLHSTSFQTLCDVDPQNLSCTDVREVPVDSGPPPTDFCATFHPSPPAPAPKTTARAAAQHACAWLAACESPLGSNAFGACMVNAILAYDCDVNPNRQVKGDLHDYWDALLHAKTCADVTRAVFPGTPNPCPASGSGAFAACGLGPNAGVRVECDPPATAPRGESCLVAGRTCDPATRSCTGQKPGQCVVSHCSGTVLHDCTDGGDGGDQGTECALFGSGECTMDAGAPACIPEGASACGVPSSVATCLDSGAATACPAGSLETIDCTQLTGAGSCNAGALSPTWDLSSVCAATEAGACAPDTCAGNLLTSCARGQTFTVACDQVGLGPCALFVTVDGERAACTPR